MRYIRLAIFYVIAVAAPVIAEDTATLDRWDRTVCLHSVGDSGPKSQTYASGFVVQHDSSLYLITAGHAAEQTRRASRLRFLSSDRKSQWVSLAILGSANGTPWVRHRSSDLSIARISESEQAAPYLKMFTEIAFPFDQLEEDPPPRTTEIEVAGFPFGFGTEPNVSPLVVQTRVASTVLEAANQWGTEPIIYTFPAIAQGTSGGPAFLVDADHTASRIVGMYVGVVFDGSGGKLSKILPARVIREALLTYPKSDADE